MSAAAASEERGFIVHSFTRTVRGATQICLVGRLASGDTFAAIVTSARPRLFIRESEGDRARALPLGADLAPSGMRTMDGEPCFEARFSTPGGLARAQGLLDSLGLRTYEADMRPQESFLMDRHIHGSLSIRGASRPGKRVDKVFVDPELGPSEWEPRLSLLSIDIETNPYGEEIYAVGLSFVDPSGEVGTEEVLLFAPDGRGQGDLATPIRRYASEAELLEAFKARLVELDPDLITGWNVIDFDCARILKRMETHGIAPTVGRSDEPMKYLPGSGRKPSALVVPGRQALDGIRIMRSAPQRFLDQSLQTVAEEVLGYGKEIAAPSGRAKLEEIERMYREEPERLCGYCLADARLAREILAKTGMMKLTLKRCELIGVPLSRAWTSIAAFDFIYIEAMHERGLVAPTLGVDALPLNEAPGGAIISPMSGVFDNVFVFDFRSLYPSIIRTFNIDPVTFVPEYRAGDYAAGELIRAPGGAGFSREEAILPRLLERFFAKREEAKASGDAVASHIYKILSNSFYGVLGAAGCRFAGSDIAGSITGFGHHILYWCRDFLEARGFRTLYGDTDSLFVQSNLDDTAGLRAKGGELCDTVNRELARHVAEVYGVESKLVLQFEKIYSRFFVPPLRAPRGFAHRSDGETQPGRAKGYAGALLGESGSRAPGERLTIEVKGMEAVRRDWTQAAKGLQLALIERVFERRTAEEIADFVRGYIREITSGRRDRELVYTKALRKSVDEYSGSQPAHVKAALRLDPTDQLGLINYVWTTEGPQPVDARTAPIDYEHYLQKQLRPIAGTLSEVLHMDLEELFNRDGQLRLF